MDHNRDTRESYDPATDTTGIMASTPPPQPESETLLGSKPMLALALAESSTASADIPSRTSLKYHSRLSVLALVLRRTIFWIILGISIMLLGIGIVQGSLLPFIHTCPPDASCPKAFDLNSTNVLQLLQTLMSYWLKIGVLIAAFGLLRLSAYQSWLVIMRDGNTMDNLELTMGAIKGSFFDAARLLLKRGNRWLSLFVLAQLAINSAISLLVGLSISRENGQRVLVFSYQSITQFPDSSLRGLNSDGQLKAISKVDGWALGSDLKHDNALLGTLVIPDGRSSNGVNTLPGGPKLNGDISCKGIDNYTISVEENGLVDYVIGIGGHAYIAHTDMQLAVSMTGVGTAQTPYIWTSNTSGILPNATVSSDGRMYFSFCTHTITLDEYPRNGSSNTQYVEPNTPVISGCSSTSSNVCVSDSVNNAVLNWWGGVGNAFWMMSCRGGVLGPLKSDGTACSLTRDLWKSTASSMLDGLVQTSPRSGQSSQKLLANVEHLSTRRWWLQGLIPLFTLLLYFAMVFYTVAISQGDSTFKELNLSEIIGAAQTDHVRELVYTGALGKTRVRYTNSEGFTLNPM